MELIIAEKPSVARDLARVLGMRPSGKGAYEGGGRTITWCVGHLVELEEPVTYDRRWKAWRLETLPMLPTQFKLRPAKHAADQLKRGDRAGRAPSSPGRPARVGRGAHARCLSRAGEWL